MAQPDPRGTSHEKASSLTMAEDAPSEGYLPSPTVPPSEMTLQKDVNDIESPKFRLYKRRFLGVSGLFLLNIVGGMTYPWFGPIANEAASELDISLTRVNWLSNMISLVYLPVAIGVPIFCARYGVRRSCEVGSVCLALSSWIRYSGTIKSLPTSSLYSLLIIGQLLAGVAQPIFQVLGPAYSELWFDTQGRTTATAILAISNPLGAAIGQILSPMVGSTRTSILVLGIACTVVAPCCLLVDSKPPSPPTYAASHPSPPLSDFIRAWFGLSHSSGAHMSGRERIDFTLLCVTFSVLVAATTTFSNLSNQYFEPHGYDSTISGLFGAALLGAGLVAAIVSGPVFDRVLTNHLAICIKCLCPPLGLAWLALVWAVRPNNSGAIFALMALIGVCSLPLLPMGLELAVEVTRNADASSALLFFGSNVLNVVFLAIENALRAGPGASPPLNMKTALLFQGIVVLVACSAILAIRGEQTRRSRDIAMVRAESGTFAPADLSRAYTLKHKPPILDYSEGGFTGVRL